MVTERDPRKGPGNRIPPTGRLTDTTDPSGPMNSVLSNNAHPRWERSPRSDRAGEPFADRGSCGSVAKTSTETYGADHLILSEP